MHLVRLLAILGVSLAGHGCSLIYSGTSGVAGEVKLALTHHQLLKQARQQAQTALQELRTTNRGANLSRDFEVGFEDGYVRTVWWGAEETPIIPPSEYWAARYQAPEGRKAIADWTEGYRLGVNVALQTGAALSMKLPGAGQPAGKAGAGPAPVPIQWEPQTMPGGELEKLPAPRPLPPAARLPAKRVHDSEGPNTSIVLAAHQVIAAPPARQQDGVSRTQPPAPARWQKSQDWPALPGPESPPLTRAKGVEDLPPVQLGRPR